MTNSKAVKAARAAQASNAAAQQVSLKAARRRLGLVGAVLGFLAAVVVCVVFVVHSGQPGAPAAIGSAPAHTVGDTYVVGQASAPVVLDVWEDFLCPACGQFEQTSAGQIGAWVAAGNVAVRYHVISFLDRSSPDQYSSRAANAAAVVVDTDPSAFAAFHASLFANQPAENAAGLSDDRLVDLAVAAGLERDVARRGILGRPFAGWVAQVTDIALTQTKIEGTPTIRVNGVELRDHSASALAAAVATAAATRPTASTSTH